MVAVLLASEAEITIFCEMSRALKYVNHKILSSKPKQLYGLRGNFAKWLCSYL